MSIRFNSKYLSSDRAVCKLVEIVLGFVVCAILCANWYGGSSCFGEGRIGFASGLNFVVVVINIVLFLINLCNIQPFKLEQLYNVIAAVLFFIAVLLVLWYMIAWGNWTIWLIVAEVVLIILFILFQWDFKANRNTTVEEHLPI